MFVKQLSSAVTNDNNTDVSLGMQKLEGFLHNYLTLSVHECIPHKELSPVQAESLNIHNQLMLCDSPSDGSTLAVRK